MHTTYLSIVFPALLLMLLLGTAGILPRPDPGASALGHPQASPTQEMPRPGPEHKLLAAHAGSYTYQQKMRMSPEAPWMTSTGSYEAKLACGGFFVFATSKGSFMGMPFEGFMQLGYDQFEKKYVGTWVDNFGSYISMMEGTYNKKSQTLTMLSDMLNPETGKTMKVKMTTRYQGKDKMFFEMWMPGPDGKSFKTMEIAYTRKP